MQEEKAESKKKGQRTDTVVGVRMAITASGDPEIELLKTQVSQLIEMMIGILSQVSQVAKVDTVTTPRL